MVKRVVKAAFVMSSVYYTVYSFGEDKRKLIS